MKNSSIYSLLQSLGITSNYKGCKQLALAVQLALREEDRLHHMTKEIYWSVAYQMGCHHSSVERNIRTIAHVAWRTNPELLQRLAGYPLQSTPTASELITILTAYIQRHQLMPSVQ